MAPEPGREISVLVVDDEPSFREGLVHALTAEGFAVRTASDGAEALDAFRAQRPDLVLLDVMLPIVSGIDVCRQIRAEAETPVIMVSARSEEIDAVVGLEVGADDYIAKPYRLRELVARMRTVLRRHAATEGAAALGDGTTTGADREPAAQRNPSGPSGPSGSIGPSGPSSTDRRGSSTVAVDDLELDEDRHEVRLAGELVDLPLKEFQLLAQLMRNVGYVVTRADLIDRVWGYDYVGDTKTLDVHIKRLRSKLEADPSSPKRIVTIRGLGYKMIAHPNAG